MSATAKKGAVRRRSELLLNTSNFDIPYAAKSTTKHFLLCLLIHLTKTNFT